jgi:Mlc titration factor MtfA (ptsG expression regulator)
MRVTSAAQASVLLLHRETDYYPRLTSILIYPAAYVVPETRTLAGGFWQTGDSVRLGHTGARLDALVISWDDTLRGARCLDDGRNLVLHEFAHQLDFEDRSTDGTPLLQTPSQYTAWIRALEPEYQALRAAADAGAPTFLDQYGATNPAEFFAVVTEFFFEKPRELLEKHPAIYQQLRAFHQQDPASWRGTTS